MPTTSPLASERHAAAATSGVEDAAPQHTPARSKRDHLQKLRQY
jgi:hypothetical protein